MPLGEEIRDEVAGDLAAERPLVVQILACSVLGIDLDDRLRRVREVAVNDRVTPLVYPGLPGDGRVMRDDQDAPVAGQALDGTEGEKRFSPGNSASIIGGESSSQ